MSVGKKVALGVLIFFVVLLGALVIVVPLLLDVDRYRDRVAARIREVTGKPAAIGHLAIRLFPTVSIRVDDFALGNPAGFPQGYILKVRRISAELDARALWDRQILIKSLDLDQPEVKLLADGRGRWNFENPRKGNALKAAFRKDESAFSLDVIPRVTVSKARLTAANLLPSGRPGPAFFEGQGVTTDLEDVDLDALASPGHSAAVYQADLGHETTAARLLISVAYAAAPPMRPAARGTLRAESLRFGSLQATSVKTRLRLYPGQVFFDDLKFDFYGGRADGDVSFDSGERIPRYAARARLSGVDLARLLEAFPEARGKLTGKMEGDLKVSGELSHSPDPLAGMRGAGQVNIRNGEMPSLQLNKNLMALARVGNFGASTGSPSSFSSMSADFTIADQRITSSKVRVAGNGIDVDGSGSLALAGAGSLDYQGVANIAAGATPLTNLLVNLSGGTFANGKLTFPFNIRGSMQNPQFSLKSGAGGAGQAGKPSPFGATTGVLPAQQSGQTQQKPGDLVQGIVGLFKKKQTPQPQQSAPQPPK